MGRDETGSREMDPSQTNQCILLIVSASPPLSRVDLSRGETGSGGSGIGSRFTRPDMMTLLLHLDP